MNMNKSLTAVAVAGVIAMPMSQAQAQPEGWYGFIATGIESSSIDRTAAGAGNPGAGPAAIFHTNTGADGEGGTGMADIIGSRFGWGGSEDLGNGLSADYQFELTVPGNTAGNVSERISRVGLSGDFGSISLGQQWSSMYNYLGWTAGAYRFMGHGGGAYYYHTANFTNLASYGLRMGNSLKYTYGAGAFGDDPFTFSVDVVSNSSVYSTAGGVTAGGTTFAGTQSDEVIDALSLAAQGTYGVGDGSMSWVAYYGQEEASAGLGNSSTRTPSLFGVGGNWTQGPIYVGVLYMQSDFDADSDIDDNPTSAHVTGEMDFGGGFSGRLNYSTVDGDDLIDDMDSNVTVGIQQALSSRTFIDVEYETIDYDNTGDESVFYAGLRHSF